MRILYIGETAFGSTSVHRANALRRIGHEVFHINTRKALPYRSWVGGVSVRFGFGIFSPLILRRLKRLVGHQSHDLIWINCGAELCPTAYRFLKARAKRIIHYQ